MHLIIDRFLSRSLLCSLPATPALPPLPRAAVCRAAHRIALGHLEDPAVDLVLLLPLDGCPRARTCCCLHSRCRCCCCCPSLAVIFVGAGSATTAVVVNIVTASALALFHHPNGQTAGPSPSPGPAAPRTPRTPCLSGPACNPASRATHLQWLTCCDKTAGVGGLLMHSATLPELRVAATTTTTSLRLFLPITFWSAEVPVMHPARSTSWVPLQHSREQSAGGWGTPGTEPCAKQSGAPPAFQVKAARPSFPPS